VVMQASLYHFLPDARGIIDRMLEAAVQQGVVSEPVRTLASSENPLIGLLGRRAADPGVGGGEGRFTEQTLSALMDPYRDRVSKTFAIPGGRERVYVLDAR